MKVSTIQLFALCSLFVQALGDNTETVAEDQEESLKPANIFQRYGLESERRDIRLCSKDLNGKTSKYYFFGSVEVGWKKGWHNITISREQCCEGKSDIEAQTWVNDVKSVLDKAGVPDKTGKLTVSMVVSSSVNIFRREWLEVLNSLPLPDEPLWNEKEDLYTMKVLSERKKDRIKAQKELKARFKAQKELKARIKAQKELALLKTTSKSEPKKIIGNSEKSKTTTKSKTSKTTTISKNSKTTLQTEEKITGNSEKSKTTTKSKMSKTTTQSKKSEKKSDEERASLPQDNGE